MLTPTRKAEKAAETYDAVPFAMDARKNSPDLAEMVEKTVAKHSNDAPFFSVDVFGVKSAGSSESRKIFSVFSVMKNAPSVQT